MLEAARNVACTGAEPLALTDCLNFGNPEKPEIAWELVEAIEGMADACAALGIPVVSGNVSLYNETDGRAIEPTPVVGCVGLLPDVRAVPRGWREGDVVLLAGASRVSLAGSEYQARYGEVGGPPPQLELAAEAALVAFLGRVAPGCSLVHDSSAGGLAVALAEAALFSGVGAELDLPEDPRAWFGEGGGQAVLACAAATVGSLDGVPLRRLGVVGGEHLLGVPLAELAEAIRLMCGVFGVRSEHRDVARLTYFGLFALQHRGQESAGIAVSEGGRLTVLRDMGLVAQAFDEEKLHALPGDAAIGHTRYSTTGSAHWSNAQPLVHHGPVRTVAIGHNGNLTNTTELRAALEADGIALGATSDTEVIAALIAHDPSPLPLAVAHAMERLEGAFSVAVLSEGTLVGFRDANGIRPLALGRLANESGQSDWVLASETCAFDLVGARFEREIRPGELVVVDAEGLRSTQALPEGRHALCIFEHVYFARPDSTLAGAEVHGVRVRMGERLAAEAPVEADLVMPIPDSGTPAAVGYSRASGIPFTEGLIKNRYVGRTFIEPDQALRQQGIKLKFNPLAEVRGRRLVIVDDSIVRGNTMRQLVAMLSDAGAAEIHVRISSPPVVSPCFYGIDMGDHAQLAAAGRSVEEMREHIGATSLHYLSLDGMQAATRLPEESVCRACFTRSYPTRVPEEHNLAKLRFELVSSGVDSPNRPRASAGADGRPRENP